MRQISAEELKAQKAKALMYKRPALASMGYDLIFMEMEEIAEACDNVRYAEDVGELLCELIGEEESYEFHMMFSELANSCDQLFEAMTNNYVREDFDDCTVALVGNRYRLIGYDGYEEDYFALCSYDEELANTEAGKRFMRHTKAEMLSIAGQCFGALMAFLDLRQKYDYLKAVIDIVTEKNAGVLEMVNQIDRAYEVAERESDGFKHQWFPSCKDYDRLLEALPQRMWLE